MTIREILNKLLWNSRWRTEDYEIVFIHRGAYKNRKTITCNLIKAIQPSWFIYVDETGGETAIPFHRILEIRNVKTGESIWRTRRKTASNP